MPYSHIHVHKLYSKQELSYMYMYTQDTCSFIIIVAILQQYSSSFFLLYNNINIVVTSYFMLWYLLLFFSLAFLCFPTVCYFNQPFTNVASHSLSDLYLWMFSIFILILRNHRTAYLKVQAWISCEMWDYTHGHY